MTLHYNIAFSSTGDGTITITNDGAVVTVDNTHPNFWRIAKALEEGENPSALLISVEDAVTQIDDRVSVSGGVVTFDGEDLHNSLAETIVRYVREGRDATGLVKFMERLNENPSRRSREQLFSWTQAKDLTIDDEGYFIAYKGVSGHYKSLNSGFAIVDGVEMNGNIPNQIGSTIEMPRRLVQDDPAVGCSHGLHVGNYSYASGFGQVLLEVRVDPKDVVSVPQDCGFQKLRCCKYKVLAVHDIPEDDLSDYEPEAYWDDEGDEDFDDTFGGVVPPSFVEKLRATFGRR